MILRRAGQTASVILPCGHARKIAIVAGNRSIRCTARHCRLTHQVEVCTPPSGRTDVLEVRYRQEVPA